MPRRVCVFSGDNIKPMARAIVGSAAIPGVSFSFHDVEYGRFPDGSPNILIHDVDDIANRDVVFVASFTSAEEIYHQFDVLFVLSESFVRSLTIVLPFYPTATMERVTEEGRIATANTLAWRFNSLPSVGRPAALVLYDLHTLQNRFYLKGQCLPRMVSAIPPLKKRLGLVDGADLPQDLAIAFPDDGAQKRFGGMFPGLPHVVMAKVRGDGDVRRVTIKDGSVKGRHVIIIDDLVQSGGTLVEAAKVASAGGAISMSCFVTHAVFPDEGWRKFLTNGGGAAAGVFDKFYITNSIPIAATAIAELDDPSPFEVLDLTEDIIEHLTKLMGLGDADCC